MVGSYGRKALGIAFDVHVIGVRFLNMIRIALESPEEVAIDIPY